jgi:hypothetical protein
MSSGNSNVLQFNAISARQTLAEAIADDLKRQGYHVAQVEGDRQELIDLEWAALTAGRILGRKTVTYGTDAAGRIAGRVTVVLAPRENGTDLDCTDGYLRLLRAVLAQPA